MTMGRYVLLLLARPDAPWVESVRQRVAAGQATAELIICARPEEVCIRLGSGRPHSALLLDASAELDPDVAATAEATGTPVISVGASLDELAHGLAARARPVPRADRLPPSMAALLGTAFEAPARQGRLVGVCGPGGTGTSVVAMSLAHGLAHREDVLLADFARRAHQALLHQVPEVAGGLLDFVRIQRGRPPSTGEVRSATIPIAGQPYRLLPGLGRSRHWVAVRPRAFDAALTALQSAFGLVIADIPGDLEGEADTGSLEIEERNHMARRVAGVADLVVVVGGTSRTTRHAMGETVDDLRAVGVDAGRILTVANRVSSRWTGCGEMLSLPEVVLAEDGVLPASLVIPLRDAVAAALLHLPSSSPQPVALRPVVPGALGCWEGSG